MILKKMAAQTQRTVLKEILIEDSDQFLKPETGAKPEPIQNEQDEIGKSETCGSLNKRELEGRGSYLRSGLSFRPSTSKRNQDDNTVICGFPEVGGRKSKTPFGLRRLEDATVILRRVKDPQSILSNVEVVSQVRTITDPCEAADVAGKNRKDTLEPMNANTEEEFKLAVAANSQECSVVVTRLSALDSLELSLSIQQDSVAIVGLDVGKSQTYKDSSNMSSNSSSVKEEEVILKNQHSSEDPTIIRNLLDAITTSSTELSSDTAVTSSNLEGSTLTMSPSQSSSSLEVELHPAQSSEAYDLPTPVSMTISPEDSATWVQKSQRNESETGDGNTDDDAEVLLNFSRVSDFEACSGLSGLEELDNDLKGTKEMDEPRSSKKKLKRLLRGRVGDFEACSGFSGLEELDNDLKGTKEMDEPRSSKKKLKRLLRDDTSEPRLPETSCDTGSTKKRSCRRMSPRLKRTSGVTEESESEDAVKCSKEGINACKETQGSENNGDLIECEHEIKAELEDRDTVGDQLKFENEMLIDAICQPRSLRSRRSSVIQDVKATSAEPASDETKADVQLGDVSLKVSWSSVFC